MGVFTQENNTIYSSDAFMSQAVQNGIPVEAEEAACILVGEVGPAWRAGLVEVVEEEDGGERQQAGRRVEAA